MKTFTLLNTHQLSVNDVVNCHGSLFRLVERFSEPSNLPTGGDCVWFTTEYLGAFDQFGESIPKHWRDNWTVQGNANAKWHVVVSPIVGRHILSDGYVTIYRDGSFTVIPWTAAP
jgi:hypothetical protein